MPFVTKGMLKLDLALLGSEYVDEYFWGSLRGGILFVDTVWENILKPARGARLWEHIAVWESWIREGSLGATNHASMALP